MTTNDIIRCTQPGCGRTYDLTDDVADALDAGWVMLAGRWLCPDDAAGGGRLDGIDQGDDVPEAVLSEAEPVLIGDDTLDGDLDGEER